MKSEKMDKYLVKGYLPTIGIECHVQLKTKTKLFGTASNEAREAKPNTLVDQVCFGLPGALPVLNKAAVKLAAKAAYALGTKPQKFSKFDRKHYFYPDLPKGYQISQFDQPIILGGSITIHLGDGTTRKIEITRAHMEEDAGKSTHPEGVDYSLVDLNRAGTPLLEIVSEPQIHSAEEAKAYAKELWLRMKYADVSDVDLYHGNMRFDVNVSVSKDPQTLGTRSETKNLNSFKAVERAVEFEIKRQISLLDRGEVVIQETRGWLDDTQKTVSQRSKEDAHDYRYFPDPDIPPVILTDEYISEIELNLPTMPEEWREKLRSMNLSEDQVSLLIETSIEEGMIDYLGLLVDAEKKVTGSAQYFANWFINVDIPLRRERKITKPLSEDAYGELYSTVHSLVAQSKLSSTNAKKLLSEMITVGVLPKDIEKYATENGYIQMSDSSELEAIVEQVINDNPKPAEDVRNGEMKAISYLVGQTMKASQGKANPAEAQKVLRNKLGV